MNFSEIIRSMLQMYGIIVTGILAALLLDNLAVGYPLVLDSTNVAQIFLLALLGTLPTFIFYSSRELSKKALMIRSLIHIIVLEVLMLGAMYLMRWFDPGNLRLIVMIAVSVLVIYLIVRFVQWFIDKKDADEINRRLKEFKEE
ncbi:MAG: DUF3021 family protein [Bacillota bacterium]|nr:DUF3021 family protein [Bacillota bacterium]